MKLDLEELRRLHEAATPGPWEAVPDKYVQEQCDGIFAGVRDQVEAEEGYDSRAAIVITDSGVYPPRMPDAALITAARNALPALLARAEVYEAAVALIAAEDMPPHTPFDGNSPEWDAKFDAEHAARKALRAALARVQEVENG